MSHEVGCGADYSTLFVTVDGRGPITEVGATTKTNLDEHQFVPMPHHQIDLTRASSIVSGDDPQAAATQITRRSAFGTSSKSC